MESDSSVDAGLFGTHELTESHDSCHFTKRETEILKLLADGLQDKEITRRLHISFGTLRTHISRLFQKSGHRRRSGLAALWATSPSTARWMPAKSHWSGSGADGRNA